MIVTTLSEIPGRRIAEHHGLVRGNTIRARHLGRDVMAVLRNVAGGEIDDVLRHGGDRGRAGRRPTRDS